MVDPRQYSMVLCPSHSSFNQSEQPDQNCAVFEQQQSNYILVPEDFFNNEAKKMIKAIAISCYQLIVPSYEKMITKIDFQQNEIQKLSEGMTKTDEDVVKLKTMIESQQITIERMSEKMDGNTERIIEEVIVNRKVFNHTLE